MFKQIPADKTSGVILEKHRRVQVTSNKAFNGADKCGMHCVIHFTAEKNKHILFVLLVLFDTHIIDFMP